MRKRLFLLFYLFVFLHFTAHAEPSDTMPAFNDKVWAYVNEHPTTNLFLHTDKNIYAPNERLWFKAYILSGTLIDNKVLYIRLVDAKKKVVQSMQFPMNTIVANGDILLPDSLKDGRYTLYAYADRMINFSAEDAFSQTIIVHKNRKKWRAEAYVTDTSKLVIGEKVELLVRLKQNNDLVKNIKGRYQILNGGEVVKKGGLKTNLVGECFIEFVYPTIPDDKALRAVISFDDEDDREEIYLNLGHRGNKLQATIHAPNDQLVEGIPNTVAVSMADVNGQPISVNLTLMAGRQKIAEKGSDSAGIALLSFTPVANTKYWLQLQNNGKLDSIVLETPIVKNGYTLQAWVENEQCHININASQNALGAYMVLRSFDSVFFQQKVDIKAGSNNNFVVPMASFTKLVFGVALIDNNQQLLAEELLLNRQQEDVAVTISVDRKQFGTRKKITVLVNAVDRFGQPVSSNFSVAVAEKNTIDSSVQLRINDAFLYRHVNNINNFLHDNTSINNLLHTASWKDYAWPEILAYTPAGRINILHNTAGVSGSIKSYSKKKKLLEELPILSKAGIQFIAVNKTGNFDIEPETLLGASNERTKLMLGNDFIENYSLKLQAYEEEFDKRFCEYYLQESRLPTTRLSRYQMERLEKLTNPHELQNVVVKLTKNLPFSYGAEDYVSPHCSDYVCINNIFNCPNHKSGFPPTVGSRYKYQNRSIIYRGCGDVIDKTRPIMILKSITLPNTFQVIDFEKEPEAEADDRTTIYWNPNLYTDKTGQTSFSFFTNDVAGDFEIILQGITRTKFGIGTVSGHAGFSVADNKSLTNGTK